jgi:hypothetical protein
MRKWRIEIRRGMLILIRTADILAAKKIPQDNELTETIALYLSSQLL